jgi:sulfur carrier protein ThiS
MEGSKKIRVYLDGKPVSIFEGMKVKHILDTETLKCVRMGTKVVIDEDGNQYGLEGSLTEGDELRIKTLT